MKYPLNKIPDVNYYHYTCRCRFICAFTATVSNITCGGLFIWHIDHDGNETKYDWISKRWCWATSQAF